jgi:hypothetical protein
MQKEAIMAQPQKLSLQLPDGIGENHQHFRQDIQTGHPLNTSQKHYGISQDDQFMFSYSLPRCLCV